ncbi:MAG: helix-turn-helix transcriptional regulator, partial [Eggerthellaceae bacterium]|nr:helix-turn-helix transcriptional regulator [Eggerthellaceae bacterium]
MKQKTHPIRAARQRHGLSQQELADAIGTTKGAVSSWEIGKAMPRPDTAKCLITKFPGLTVEKIYG